MNNISGVPQETIATKLYSWQSNDYEAIVRLFLTNSQTALLIGKEGLGITQLVKVLIERLLCLSPQGIYSCGKCKSCELLINSEHPDLYTLSAQTAESKKSQYITTEQVRDMINYANLSPHYASYKIILIPDTHELSISAANALLKIIEEPPSHAIFILVCYNLGEVLPTLKSRCQKYLINPPQDLLTLASSSPNLTTTNNSEFWLQYYDNCPLFTPEINDGSFNTLLKALYTPSVENIFALIAELEAKNFSFEFFIEFMLKWLSDIITFYLTNTLNYFGQWQQSIEPLMKRFDIEEAFLLSDRLSFLSKWTRHPLSHKIQATNLLFSYQALFNK